MSKVTYWDNKSVTVEEIINTLKRIVKITCSKKHIFYPKKRMIEAAMIVKQIQKFENLLSVITDTLRKYFKTSILMKDKEER